jgi:hypothetical protein
VAQYLVVGKHEDEDLLVGPFPVMVKVDINNEPYPDGQAHPISVSAEEYRTLLAKTFEDADEEFGVTLGAEFLDALGVKVWPVIEAEPEDPESVATAAQWDGMIGEQIQMAMMYAALQESLGDGDEGKVA